MTVFWSILIAVLVFGFLIMIHELGHFSVARWCGIKIDEFSIGMGPQLCGKKSKKTGTLFSIRALPIGGYVSMLGEQEACEEEGSFSQKNVWQRMQYSFLKRCRNIWKPQMTIFPFFMNPCGTAHLRKENASALSS